jgi:hypothetical protein
MEDGRLEIDINGKRFELSKQIIDNIVRLDCEASGAFVNKTKIDKISLERNSEISLCFWFLSNVFSTC